MFQRYFRFLQKVLRGQNPLKVKHVASEWDRQFAKGNWDFLLSSPQYNIAVVEQLINENVDTNRKLRVLDVGCGNGSLACRLSPDQVVYTGVDISCEALRHARAMCPHFTFLQGSIDVTSTVKGIFDVVVFCEVLLYGDYEKVIRNFQRNLSKESFVIISLYDTWRTKLILRSIRRELTINKEVYIKDKKRNIGWTVAIGKLRCNNE